MVGELEASAPDSPEVRRALEVIRRNVELEARLIDDLLDVTRISKGKLQLSLGNGERARDFAARPTKSAARKLLAKNLRIEFRLRAEARLRRRRSGAPAAGLLESDQEQREIHAGEGPDRDRNV